MTTNNRNKCTFNTVISNIKVVLITLFLLVITVATVTAQETEIQPVQENHGLEGDVVTISGNTSDFEQGRVFLTER